MKSKLKDKLELLEKRKHTFKCHFSIGEGVQMLNQKGVITGIRFTKSRTYFDILLEESKVNLYNVDSKLIFKLFKVK